jgi:hypothetical protein
MEFCLINENLTITSRFERKLSVIILLTFQFLNLSPFLIIEKCNDIALRHQKPTCKIQMLPGHFSRLDEVL